MRRDGHFDVGVELRNQLMRNFLLNLAELFSSVVLVAVSAAVVGSGMAW